MDIDTLAEAYFRSHEDDFWAWEYVKETLAELNTGWNITLQLLERAKSKKDIEYLGGSALESLIDIYGHEALDLVEEACKTNLQLRDALNSAGVLYYYDEFERWYNLLYSYGLRADPVADSAVISHAMHTMNSYLGEAIGVYDYADSIFQILDKPFQDKAAQEILQRASWDAEVIDSKKPPEYREPYFTRSELKERVRRAVLELEALGYKSSED